MGNEDPIALGVAGLGLAASFMIEAAESDPRIRLASCAEPRPGPRSLFEGRYKVRGHETFTGLCSDPAVEAIYIATPHHMHAVQAVEALQAGKHVIVEKPLALSTADCATVIAAADASGKCAIVGHSHAFDPNIAEMARLVASGEFGRLGLIHTFNYNDFLFRPHRHDEFHPQTGGGIIFNQVAHQVDMIRQIAGGHVTSVRAHVGDLAGIRQAPGHCVAVMTFDTGAVANLVFSSHGFFDSDVWHGSISEGGTQKALRSGAMRRAFAARQDEGVQHAQLSFGARDPTAEQPFLPHFGLIVASCERADLRLSPSGVFVHDETGTRDYPVPRRDHRPGHGEVLGELWNVLRMGSTPRHDVRWGAATVTVLTAILTSAKESREVSLTSSCIGSL